MFLFLHHHQRILVHNEGKDGLNGSMKQERGLDMLERKYGNTKSFFGKRRCLTDYYILLDSSGGGYGKWKKEILQ